MHFAETIKGELNMLIKNIDEFKQEFNKKIENFKTQEGISTNQISWDTIYKTSYSLYCNKQNYFNEYQLEQEKNKKLEIVSKEIQDKLNILEEKLQNEKTKNLGRKKIILTDKQKEFIKDLTLNAKAPRETIVYLFNQKYTKREKPLTVHQLRTIMDDMDLKKPKK